MDLNDLTQKSQEALHDAQTIALRYGHTEVDGEHLLLALLDQRDGIATRLLADAGADPDRLRTALEAELARRPHVDFADAAASLDQRPGGVEKDDLHFAYWHFELSALTKYDL